ncbi:DUF2007 domain-containing protein [Teredinibacter sp. KSP-S5-2]|uniref:putative signal transducing protein n=1 Tax=Teredinibacter sp. KSP-S5-2 TaxID=3034506 RepID=UPI002934DEDC|nr:DUF2007 domain-containing protein [Teredinibacter sp. KSP-S5-2]WNO08010.1 DUF2007 domain-containing protein [Teredinibacter sp. KSP-S5-2]
MKLLYEAANTIEAHIIADLLEEEGLSPRIDGEYLQGGVGELQAIGVVRIMIQESDYAVAKKIVQKWDATQPESDSEFELSLPPSSELGIESEPGTLPRKNGGIVSLVVAFLIGVGVTAAYYRSPVTEDGIDYNGDGLLDEKWVYRNFVLSKIEMDSNFDGKKDIVYTYDQKGLLKKALIDRNFDGTFETEAQYKKGNTIWEKSDTTGDGFQDYRVFYENGVIKSINLFDSTSKKIRKKQEFGAFHLKRAEVDTTSDGILDTVFEYDMFEDIVKTYPKN